MNTPKLPVVRSIMLLCFSAAMIIGCASAVEFPPYSGFLADYKGLYPSNTVKGAFISDNPVKNFLDYSQFYIAPVVVYLLPESKAYNMDPKILEKKSIEFQETLKKAFAKNYTVVDAPAEGVLVMKFAITDLVANDKVLLEATFVDGATNQRVFAFVYGKDPKSFADWASLLVSRLKELGKEKKVYTFDSTAK